MSLTRKKTVGLFLLVLFPLASIATFAADEKVNLQPKEVYLQSEDENAPTDENLWKAQQAGDFEKAARIKAILDAEATKSWGTPVHEETGFGAPGVVPPIKDDAFLRPPSWGNDVTIATGTVSGGISTDYDNLGNIYAVRCTTYAGNTNGKVDVYKSTDNGTSWSRICGWVGMGIQYTYPVVLTGTDGDPNKLYVFYLRSSGNGDIRVGRFTQSGTLEGYYAVKQDSDTITYFTACANVGVGNRLMVAYQTEGWGDTTPNIYTLLSTDRGETWGNLHYVSSDGSHPDLAYGYGGYVYMVYTKTGGSDSEIYACKNTDYAGSLPWQDFEALTYDSWNDDYAKVAALHTTPVDNQYVWVGYNHNYGGTGNWDLRFAYSTNAGVSWSKNHNLASDSDYDEMACDLWVGRRTSYVYVNICYLRTRWVSPMLRYHDIYYAYANKYTPTTWTSHGDISDYWGAFDYDGRKVCQGTYGVWSGHERGVVYAGRSSITNYYGLYFDNQQWYEEALRGDANVDGVIDIGDVVYLINYVLKDGPSPDPLIAGDCTCDGIINIDDVIFLIHYLYMNGPPPVC